MLCVIIEEVLTLIACYVERAGEDSGDGSVEEFIFTLAVYAFLMSEAVIVAIHDVAYAKFLVHPVGIGSGCIVGHFHVGAATAAVVDIIFAPIEVDDFIIVVAHIISYVDTPCESQFVGEHFVFIGRHKSIPFMRVVAHRHHHVGAGCRSRVHILDCAIVVSSVRASDSDVSHSPVQVSLV